MAGNSNSGNRKSLDPIKKTPIMFRSHKSIKDRLILIAKHKGVSMTVAMEDLILDYDLT